MSDPFRDRSEILDGAPSIRERLVEQSEYIRLLEAEVERLKAYIEAMREAKARKGEV